MSAPVSSTAIRIPVPVIPWFQSAGAPTSAVVPFDWSTSGSASASITSTGASRATPGSLATRIAARGNDATANASSVR